MLPTAPSNDAAAPWTFVACDEPDTAELGRILGALAEAGDVFALSGGLGAGKTALTQSIARGMDVVEHVPSPTFNLLLVHQGTIPLYHFDLYRLERADQLDDIDFWGTIEADGLSVIEWADRFPESMPPDRLDVTLEVTGPSERRITLKPHGPRHRLLCDAVRFEMGERP